MRSWTSRDISFNLNKLISRGQLGNPPQREALGHNRASAWEITMMIQTKKLERKGRMLEGRRLARMRRWKNTRKGRWLLFIFPDPPLPQRRTSNKTDRRYILGTLRLRISTSSLLLLLLMLWMSRTYSSSVTWWAMGSWRTSDLRTLSKNLWRLYLPPQNPHQNRSWISTNRSLAPPVRLHL